MLIKLGVLALAGAVVATGSVMAVTMARPKSLTSSSSIAAKHVPEFHRGTALLWVVGLDVVMDGIYL